MAEVLTKKALKDELKRRMDWFESAYGFSPEYGCRDVDFTNHNHALMFGRYLALREQKWQIENNMFIGGFAC